MTDAPRQSPNGTAAAGQARSGSPDDTATQVVASDSDVPADVPVGPPTSYGSASFSPGTTTAAVTGSGVPPAGSAATAPSSSPGTGTSVTPGVRNAGAATAPAARSQPAPGGASDGAMPSVGGDTDAGARDWRNQWRAARSNTDEAPTPTGDDTGTPAAAAAAAAVTAVTASEHKRSGGFRSALRAGLDQAKAVAAGTWPPPTPDANAADGSPMPGMHEDAAADSATTGTAGATATAARTSSSPPPVRVPTARPVTGSATGAAGARPAGTGAPAGPSGPGAALPAAVAGGVVGAAVGAAVGAVPATVRPGSAAPPAGRGAPYSSAQVPTSQGPGGQRPAAQRPTSRRPTAKPPSRPPAGRLRRAHLKLTRIDPWTIMKVSFMLSIAFGIMTLVAVAVVWSMLDAAGVFTSLDETVSSVTGEGGSTLNFDLMSWVAFDRVMGFATLIAVVDVVLITALSTLGSFLYNLASSLLGGVEVTFVEDHP